MSATLGSAIPVPDGSVVGTVMLGIVTDESVGRAGIPAETLARRSSTTSTTSSTTSATRGRLVGRAVGIDMLGRVVGMERLGRVVGIERLGRVTLGSVTLGRAMLGKVTLGSCRFGRAGRPVGAAIPDSSTATEAMTSSTTGISEGRAIALLEGRTGRATGNPALTLATVDSRSLRPGSSAAGAARAETARLAVMKNLMLMVGVYEG